ncbi:molybdopterin-binding protein [Chryseobacterium indologenes]|uniref:molybdopterin-dependent oxidoreductase n=1 Tax=Chryseobacterium TaxID=59732 RepID=UPI0004855CE3|nr:MULTISPECIES: molybdopterin-dependent oxidoreductase [Chryseobacterium]ATN04930.1 molybdopterin-binding protein [Chryseobacterium indologenes]AYY86319.1 molybdopterin-binding protein [Chryseobacterium indologenes]AYZ36095.1 molybdopterin-binding protein [Chryseobacterium indologenes]MBF6644888.1 molybdopterin-dependent oxidoreductase [Chryseobacterium indologenes]MBU3047789.1 molybdopterin-dependent oxidoreductase [Chryseobacterium indologenes]
MKRILPLVLLLISGWVFCQSGFKLKVSGEVSNPLELNLADLSKMTRKEALLKDKDGSIHKYSGVPVSDILARAGVPAGKELHGDNISKYLLVKCADGYQVLFSLAELDASIADKNVIVADTVDGKPLPESKGPLRLIAEGEKKPARSSYQLEALVVGQIKK